MKKRVYSYYNWRKVYGKKSEIRKLYYKTSREYAPNADRGLIWNDEDLNIDWEINFEPILSEKDKVQPKFKDINKEELL